MEWTQGFGMGEFSEGVTQEIGDDIYDGKNKETFN